MAIREILHFPDPRLRNVAHPVTEVNNEIRTLVSDMLETMYKALGIGLAATQINIRKRIVVIDISEGKNQPLVFINPEILSKEGTEETEEGCLSVPGFYETVTRAENIRVKAQNLKGEVFEMEADGLLAVCIQHEIDHLEGKLFIDYISRLKRQRIRTKIGKQSKSAATL